MGRNIQRTVKRLFDIVVSFVLILLLIAIPVLIIVPILIRIESKGNAIFLQQRVGKNGKMFNIIKFRTMLIPEERLQADGTMLEPNDSITRVGRFLRKTSIDELPQLINVFKGDMSFVGPRPMIPSMAAKISEENNRRHLMRPGVTGWAQVNGRNNLTWDEKFAFDLDYVDHFSLWMDLKIYWKTLMVIIKHEGIDYIHPMTKE